jgi:hypothetical protein
MGNLFRLIGTRLDNQIVHDRGHLVAVLRRQRTGKGISLMTLRTPRRPHVPVRTIPAKPSLWLNRVVARPARSSRSREQ